MLITFLCSSAGRCRMLVSSSDGKFRLLFQKCPQKTYVYACTECTHVCACVPFTLQMLVANAPGIKSSKRFILSLIPTHHLYYTRGMSAQANNLGAISSSRIAVLDS